MTVKKIIMVFKTHFDIGFTELSKEVIDNYSKKLLPDVLKTCRETKDLGVNRRFVWTMSAWPLKKTIEKDKISDEMLKEAESYLKSGQITWHALPFTTHTEFCGLEDFIRGLEFSKELSLKYGHTPISAKMTDVPGHTWILPSILYKAGIKFLHLGCNEGSMPPDVPLLFYWEGPDGHRILTFYNKGGYGSSALPPKDWQFPVWLSLTQLGDNGGPQSTEIVADMIDKIAVKQPNADIIIGTLDDFYNELEPFLDDSIPIIKGDLADSWIHGVGSYPKEVSQIRSLRSEIRSIEKFIVLKDIAKDIDKSKLELLTSKIGEVYENLILFGEHTWGLDAKTHLSWSRHYEKEEFLLDKKTQNHLLMEQSWDEQRQYVKNAINLVEEIKREIFSINDNKIVIFNPLAWERDEWVDVSAIREKLFGKVIIDDITSKEAEVENSINGLKMKVLSIPPMGFKTFSIAESTTRIEEFAMINENREKSNSVGEIIEESKNEYDSKSVSNYGNKFELENSWFKIKIDEKSGLICNVYDKTLDKEWIREGINGFGQYQYDIYSNLEMSEYIRKYTYLFSGWWCDDAGKIKYPGLDHKTFASTKFAVTKEISHNSMSLVISNEITDESNIEYGNGTKIITTITIYNDNKYIDLNMNILNKQETPLTEAGHIVFPLNLSDYKLKINKLGCFIDPETDIVKNANNLLYCCENCVDIYDENYGMTIITYDAPLFSIGKPAIYDFSGEYIKSEPTVYFNLFNNMWGTNFPQWIGGTFNFKFRLLPHKINDKDLQIEKIAIESVNPPILVDGIGLNFDFIDVNDNIEIIALKSADNGKGYVLRFREIHGAHSLIKIKFNISISKICYCDLIEREKETIKNVDNEVEITTQPYEIHSLYFETYKQE